jgi:hypothetical protein
VLGTGRKAQFKQHKGRLIIALPSAPPDPNDSVLQIDTL